MTPENLINHESVLSQVQVGSKKHALEMIGKLLAKSSTKLAADDVFLALIERERLGCTALANGLAVPHARMEFVEKPVAALIQLSEAIEYGAADDIPVDLIVGILLPDDFDNKEAFKELVAQLSNSENQALLRQAQTKESLHSNLSKLQMLEVNNEAHEEPHDQPRDESDAK